MLEIIETHGDDALARVFVARTSDGSCIEFVESVQPPLPREQKWVLIVSTLKGCPVRCPVCDAGGHYQGRLCASEILAQIDHLVERRFPDRVVPTPLFKIQFARMGDPAFNPEVLRVLEQLPGIYDAPGLMPSISTVAPLGCNEFLQELAAIKNRCYAPGRFQMQFSVHTTCDADRRRLIPIRTLSMRDMASAGEAFFRSGDRKITLNFAPVRGFPIDADDIAALFDPELFAIKLTPVNPTYAARRSGLQGLIDPNDPAAIDRLSDGFRKAGFQTIVSIGELRENDIGSNCGMFVQRALRKDKNKNRD
jgi:23S rRNA (adenine2503-C2)-methyltransferase